jgi:WD40 repeat protein
VYTVAFSPDGRILASGGVGGSQQVLLWDVATGRQIGALPSLPSCREAPAPQ